ncbi:Xylose isomerase domain protein TIM barrel [Kribbella flavida DSM 17836]|uniref:Xylose isomerase domain protein TIM barrel n=1 Tax=Kribbella flavida (strain DSM 17836 / JCM 10339 / NBRC 14399) TaxID=479435 RepID=D2PW83_KRIFD|nr:metabolite traffic protein EboE [Kribbella flavida]ADB31535.1 Xylose isomerase domain protein TIM barrel [Kribbella flavida DSM 17836]
MRFRHPDGSTVHLAYSTHVHPAEDLDGVIAQLDGCSSLVRKALDVPVLGIGLWLAHELADQLANSPAALNRLRRALGRNALEVVMLNGLPYADFRAKVVGQQVYLPDWTQPERLRYTLDLIEVLAKLMPTDAAYGSISTPPLAWRFPWSRRRDAVARQAFDRLQVRLAQVGTNAGRRIRIALEPEPGCVLEMVPQATHWLTPYAGSALIGLCLDTCHLAVQFEDPAASFAVAQAAGVEIVRSQLSAALHVPDPRDEDAQRLLNEFAEPKFLHQTREWGGPGVDNLDQADQLSGHAAWRVHFHVPVHAPPRAPLTSTTGVLEDCLNHLVGGPHPLTHHLESETYAWSILPDGPTNQQELAEGIAAELSWLRQRIVAHGLEELT